MSLLHFLCISLSQQHCPQTAGSQCGALNDLRSTVMGRRLSWPGFMYILCMSVFLYSMTLSKLNGSKKQMLACKNTSLCITNPSLSLNQPTTAFTLKFSRKPPRSSFLTSTTQCSKLSILTLALVSWATSSNALPNRFFP